MTFTYTKNGYDISCYGMIEENSNFYVEYEDENDSGIIADLDTNQYNTWTKICDHLIKEGHTDILQIESVLRCL